MELPNAKEEPYLTAQEVLGMMGKSIRQRWPVDPEKKAEMVRQLESMAANEAGNVSEKSQLTAIKLIKEMEDANFRELLQVGELAHKLERFETLASMESTMQRAFSDGPVIDVVISDAPMAAIEHTLERGTEDGKQESDKTGRKS
jgi:hypothetical protein